jgi:hypothetical protein
METVENKEKSCGSRDDMKTRLRDGRRGQDIDFIASSTPHIGFIGVPPLSLWPHQLSGFSARNNAVDDARAQTTPKTARQPAPALSTAFDSVKQLASFSTASSIR